MGTQPKARPSLRGSQGKVPPYYGNSTGARVSVAGTEAGIDVGPRHVFSAHTPTPPNIVELSDWELFRKTFSNSNERE